MSSDGPEQLKQAVPPGGGTKPPVAEWLSICGEILLYCVVAALAVFGGLVLVGMGFLGLLFDDSGAPMQMVLLGVLPFVVPFWGAAALLIVLRVLRLRIAAFVLATLLGLALIFGRGLFIGFAMQLGKLGR